VDTEAKIISLGLKQIEPNPWEQIEEKYPIGSKIKGRIRNIADFGIFVEVNGAIDGLAHISDLAWVQNFASPSEVFKKGDEVEAVVLHIDPENERFSRGIKQLLDDPWDRISKSYLEGTGAHGTVVRLSGAGAVVRLEEGIEGLIPERERPEDLKEGDEIDVVVKRAEPKDRRFILGLAEKPESAEAKE
jgi:small subunit ribosomal protein S1